MQDSVLPILAPLLLLRHTQRERAEYVLDVILDWLDICRVVRCGEIVVKELHLRGGLHLFHLEKRWDFPNVVMV